MRDEMHQSITKRETYDSYSHLLLPIKLVTNPSNEKVKKRKAGRVTLKLVPDDSSYTTKGHRKIVVVSIFYLN